MTSGNGGGLGIATGKRSATGPYGDTAVTIATAGSSYKGMMSIALKPAGGVNPPQYTLTINTVGSGTVTKNPDKATYNADEVVTLTANPSTGWSFSAWSGDANGTANPTTVTMNGNKTVTATFSILTFTISGNAGVGGATMNGLPSNPVSDANGNYTGTVTYGWSGTVTPAKTGYTFNPASKTYTNVISNQTGQDYIATQLTYTISGNAGVGGATMGGLPSNPVSDANGNYTGTVTYGWSGTVTPTKAGYTFSPASQVYTSVTSNQIQNYAATLNTYTISGSTGVADVNLEGLGVVSDGSGNYTKTVDYGWGGTVTPTKAGYTFSPASQVYTSVTSNQIQNYAATLNTYTISGSTGVADVNLEGLGVVSDGSGNYTKTVDYGWGGTVTPTKAGYTFSPASQDLHQRNFKPDSELRSDA